MNERIKLIGLDLDGTLLNSQKQISPRNKKAIEAALKKGVIVVVATGRPLAGIPDELLSIPGMNYALTTNGASVINLKENRVIYSNLLDYESSIQVLKVVCNYDAMVDIYINGEGYTSQSSMDQLERYVPNEPMRKYVKKSRKVVPDVLEYLLNNKQPLEKINMFCESIPKKTKIFQELMIQFPNMAITSSIDYGVEINKGDANKGDGMLKLGKILGIEKEQIMACGDGGNDLLMLKAVGLGVAMGNASKEIQEAADFVTLTSDEDGVAAAIEKWVLYK